MKKPQAPCLKCKNSGTLHDRCDLYSKYKEDMEIWKQICREAKSTDDFYKALKYDRLRKYKKHNHIKDSVTTVKNC